MTLRCSVTRALRAPSSAPAHAGGAFGSRSSLLNDFLGRRLAPRGWEHLCSSSALTRRVKSGSSRASALYANRPWQAPRAGALSTGLAHTRRQPTYADSTSTAAAATRRDGHEEGTWPSGRAALTLPLIASRRTSSLAALFPHQLVVACGVATFWRGTWYIMDATFPHDPLTSGILCLSAGVGSFAVLQSLAGPLLARVAPEGPFAPVVRVVSLYSLAISVVAVWRGVWCLLDALSENVAGSTVDEHLLHSGIVSHVGAVGVLLVLGRMTSILAAPAKTGLLNDNKLWSALPETIRWLDWTLLEQLFGTKPQPQPKPHGQRQPLKRHQSASEVAAASEAVPVNNVEHLDEADAADGGPWNGSHWSSRVRSSRRIRIRRLYSSDDS